MNLIEAAQMALDALEEAQSYTSCETWSPSMTEECAAAAEAIRAALAQPEQEPVALPDWFNHAFPGGKLEAFGFHMPTPRAYAEEMYKRWQRRFDELSAPPQREWQGLTDEERQECLYSDPIFGMAASTFARAIEAKLREKNS